MEISNVSADCIKLKSKQASIIVDPISLRGKVEGDAIILFKSQESGDFSKVEGYRLVIDGPGEYEVSGIKILGSKSGKDLMYQFSIDNVDVMLVLASSVEKAKDKLSSHQILLLCADGVVSMSTVATLEPRVVVVYGENASKIEDAEGVTKAGKYSTTKDKLPEKMEVILLSV